MVVFSHLGCIALNFPLATGVICRPPWALVGAPKELPEDLLKSVGSSKAIHPTMAIYRTWSVVRKNWYPLSWHTAHLEPAGLQVSYWLCRHELGHYCMVAISIYNNNLRCAAMFRMALWSITQWPKYIPKKKYVKAFGMVGLPAKKQGFRTHSSSNICDHIYRILRSKVL